jgi:putative transcriptional regulator
MKKTSQRSPFAKGVLKGLEEIILHAEGKIKLKTFVVEAPDPPPAIDKAELVSLRDRLKLTQLSFAYLLNVPLSTVRLWESGKRKPSGAAARLIQVYANRPEIVEFIRHNGNGKPVRSEGKTPQYAKA